MKDSKSQLLLWVSLVLLLVSVGLLGTLAYHYYNNPQPESQIASIPVKQGVRDSLRKIYDATVSTINNRIDSAGNTGLNNSFNGIDQLRAEIEAILKNGNNEASLETARRKIGELQSKVEELNSRYTEMAIENKRLNDLVRQLAERESTDPVAQQYLKPAGYESKIPAETNNTGSGFIISDMQLSAIQSDGDKETSLAKDASKMVGSFNIINQVNQLNNNEIMVVLTQPDGKVLKNSPWESGSFETREGKKIYSCKIRFDYNRGESKRLYFSINADSFMSGRYSMMLYHNGTLIARMFKMIY